MSDTPDTRTPSAQPRCGHGLLLIHAHWDGYHPGHAGAWEPCDRPPGQGSDAPSAPNRAPTNEALPVRGAYCSRHGIPACRDCAPNRAPTDEASWHVMENPYERATPTEGTAVDMTDQRDTPDTRTPNAEGCATCGDAIAYYGEARGWRHAFLGGSALDHPATPAQGSDAPSAPNRAPTDGALTHPREFSAGTAALEWEAGHATPTEGTADRDALVDQLRGGVWNWYQAAVRAWDERDDLLDVVTALEDLTRENERLRAEDERWERGYMALNDADRRVMAERDDLRRQVAAVRTRCQALIGDMDPAAHALARLVLADLGIDSNALDTASEEHRAGT